MGTLRRADGANDDARPYAVQSFDRMYRSHVGEVYRFVHRRCRDRALAEDITHDVFVAALRSFDDPAGVSAGWLISAARNRLIDEIRRADRLSDKLRLLAAGQGDEVKDSGVLDRARLASALATLSVDRRIILMFHFVDGYSVPELAETLGRSVRSIESLIYRSRSQLRRELGGEQ